MTDPLYPRARMASQSDPSSMSISRKYVVVGIAILGIAVAAGFLTQPEPGTTFDVTWSTTSHDLGARSAPIPADGGTARVDWTVDRRNVTRAQVNVTVSSTSNHTGRDRLTIRVADPTGNASSANGTFSGAGPATLPVRHEVVEVPTVATVEADNASHAEARLAADHGSDAGRGDWAIRVTVDHSGPAAEHVVEVALEVATYRAELSPAGEG